jgi:hypothetical protein
MCRAKPNKHSSAQAQTAENGKGKEKKKASERGPASAR